MKKEKTKTITISGIGQDDNEADISPNDCDVELSDIVWDTEQEDGSRPSSKMLGLPNNVKVHSKKDLHIDKEKALCVEDITDAVGNYLCDRYGYCTISWKYKSLKKKYGTYVIYLDYARKL